MMEIMALAVFVAWIIGFGFTIGILDRVGSKCSNTYGGCFTGDSVLDLLCAVLWPFFWAIYAPYKAGQIASNYAIKRLSL